MTLPATLTWNLVGPTQIATASQAPFTSGQKPKLHLMNTFRSLINSSSYWQVDVTDTTGSMIEAVVVRPQAAKSSLPNMRIVVTMNASGALGGSSTANIMQDRVAGTAETTLANALQVGFAPDVSNAPTWVTGSWNSDRPWGNTVRWSKYWNTPAGNNASIDVMYLMETSETLLIGLKGFAGSVAHFVWYGGAIGVAFDSGSGELAQRVYGMTTTGNTLSTIFNTATTTGPFAQNTSANVDHSGFFIVSGGQQNVQANGGVAQLNSNWWELSAKARIGTLTQQADGGDRGTNTSADGNLVLMPVEMISSAAPFRSICYLRQVYMCQDYPALLPITTGSNTSNILGYTFSQNQMVANDALAFMNFLPPGAS